MFCDGPPLAPHRRLGGLPVAPATLSSMLRATVTPRETHHGTGQPSDPSPDGTTHTSESLGAAPSAYGEREPHSIPATELRDPGRYKILGEHGRGGLGRVSRAHDRDLGRDIAIKELIARGHVREMRFVREALITARLEHPGIVPVYEAGRWPDGTPFYAMKLVAGRSLRELLAERATFEERISLLHHVIAVADAIAYAHDRNIIHRDLKPANVIVGDFGETIVIDWGLAKDLTAAEDAVVEAGPFRSPADDGLTSTGSVLGTPAYMAPEQQRGEPVDQRADVHAIGVMLWELCTAQKLPPGDTGQRGTLLRRAGIDSDLASIIEKSLDPDPDRRYPHAGALAADLKAFKAGARISARRYSLFAMLSHWARRHRAIALSVATAVALGTIGVATYVRHIAAERDRVTAANNALTLSHAQLLLHSDPTAADELLQRYEGADHGRVEVLRAEARGLGLAESRAAPHGLAIYGVYPAGDGSLATLGADGLVVKTSRSGATRVIAHSTPQSYVFDYAAERHLLAFPCPTTMICLLDVQTESLHRPPADLASFAPVGLALSPRGDLLAAVSSQGDLSIWRLADPEPPVVQLQMHVDHDESLAFVDEHTLAAQSSGHVHILHLDASGRAIATAVLAVPDARDLRANDKLHLIVASTTTGQLVIIDSERDQIAQQPTICKGRLNRVAILPVRAAIGFACQDGDAGLWDLERQSTTVLVHVDGGVSTVAGSADGRYVIAGGNNGTVVVHDAATQIAHSYLGHTTRLTSLYPPSAGVAGIVSADVGGELRIWPLPDASTRVAIRTTARMFRAQPFPSDGSVVAIGDSPRVSWYTRDGASGEAVGHTVTHSQLAVSSTARQAIMFGLDDELELWSFDGEPSLRALRTGHGAASVVAYLADGEHFVVGSADGAVVEWSNDGRVTRVLGTLREPIVFMRIVRSTSAIAVGGRSGALWIFERGGMRYVGLEPNAIASVATSPDARWLATANLQGLVHLYDTVTLEVRTLQSPHPSNQYLVFSPDSATLAVASDRTISMISLPTRAAASTAAHNWAWKEVEIPVKHLAFTANNEWLAATSDRGGIWFNRRGSEQWTYLSTGSNRILFGVFTADDTQLVATDTGGRALLVNMRAIGFR